jgi:Zn-dependent protease
MKNGYWNIGTWKNIPFYMHWSVFLWLPYYWSSYHDLAWAELSLVGFLVLLVVHEAGHAIAAMSRSLRVHAIELHAFRGLCWHEPAYREEDDVLVAWGGVLGQCCLLVLALAVQYALAESAPGMLYALAPLFHVFIKANLVIAAINLLPVEPLDGYRAWRVIPLLQRRFFSGGGSRPHSGGNVVKFGRRGGTLGKLQRAASEFMDRLRKK